MTAPAASWNGSGTEPTGLIVPVFGSSANTPFTDCPEALSPPAT